MQGIERKKRLFSLPCEYNLSCRMICDGFYIHTSQYDKISPPLVIPRKGCTFRIRDDHTVAGRGYPIREK